MNEAKALLLGLVIAAGAAGAPTVATAGVAIDIDIAPPPVRVEVAPAPRVGYVWAPDRWEPRGPHWHHEPGHWERF